MQKILIVYYSVSNGNTKRIAERIGEATGADFVCETKIQFDSSGGSKMITTEKELKAWTEKKKRQYDDCFWKKISLIIAEHVPFVFALRMRTEHGSIS